MAKKYTCDHPGCNYSSNFPGPLNLHKFQAHKRKEKRVKRKYTKRSTVSSELVVIPPKRVGRPRNVVRSIMESPVKNCSWKFCPGCGSNLEELVLRIAASMSISNGQ